MNFFKKYAWIIAVSVAGIFLAGLLMHKNKQTKSESKALSSMVNMRACYLYEKESDLYAGAESTEMPTIYDREFIELSIDENNIVNGVHNILPAERDSNRAAFVGVADGGFINVIATAQAEGETWQEQRVYKTTDDRLYVGYQPVYVAPYQNKEGIYMYEDINKLSFETNEFYLSRVDCETIDKSDLL